MRGTNEKKAVIIPYQELLGNYDSSPSCSLVLLIIPYQELLGNYDVDIEDDDLTDIIPYQELLGNYDQLGSQVAGGDDYTIPRAIREL